MRSGPAGVVGGALGQRDHVGYTLLGIRLIQSRARGDNLREKTMRRVTKIDLMGVDTDPLVRKRPAR